MAETTVELTEKGSVREPLEVAENHVAVTEDQGVQAATVGRQIHVESHVWWFPLRSGAAATPETFTRGVFEGALERVSRPVRGKYADVPYSSEDLIRDKRAEVELEDR